MADLTKIEWCDATLNLWWGCTKVSEGCKFCYAEHLADHRHKKGNWGPKGTRVEVKSWRATLEKISKRAKAENRRLRVFCQSMSDTFEGSESCGGVESENWKLIKYLQDRLFEAIYCHPELDFLILTKRPENALKYFEATYQPGFEGRIMSNVWIGTSVEDQKTAEERIPHLLKIPAAVRFLSCEPLLGEVKLPVKTLRELHEDAAGMGLEPMFFNISGINPDELRLDGIHWVICGGESGPNARPMNPDWARSIRNQCEAAKVPFLFKQWGEWSPYGFGADATDFVNPEALDTPMTKVGKKLAGRMLDGRTWDGYPTPNNPHTLDADRSLRKG